MAEGRFVACDSIDTFIELHENKNTRQKTVRDIKLLETFLQTKDENRKPEEIPARELNQYLCEFFIAVRTKDGNEYEPSSLRSLLASFERYLKKENYSESIINDLAFEKTRKVLQSKQKDLKKQGKGNLPKATVPLTTDEIKIIYDKKLLGISSPEALLNTLWLNNSLHFGLRGCTEHRNMCWGDVKLLKTASGVEFLQFNERQTKTRTGTNYRDVRAVIPKMFATDGSNRDPVMIYKFFAEKRPQEMNNDEAPFYLAVNDTTKADSLKNWFKRNAVGVNKMNNLMKTMTEKAGIENPRLRNHSSRKTMVQTLSENNFPPTQIAQLSGHKNLKSIENYSHVSTEQQMNMSRVLSCAASASTTKNEKVELPTKTDPASQQSLGLFTGAVIQGGNFSITINTVNHSPNSLTSSSPVLKSRWKRLRALSDSDND